MWDDLSFRKCNLSFDWTENQTSFDSDFSNKGNRWNRFKIAGMHFTYLDFYIYQK